MLRSIIDHKKVFVLALNGPRVGGGAAWFKGIADIVFAAEGASLQIPFNALTLIPGLFQEGADVSAQGGRYGNLLQAESSGGHKKIVELILKE